MANEIITQLILDLDQFKKSLEQATKEGKDSGKKAGQGLASGVETGFTNSISSFKRELLGLASALAGAFAVRSVIKAASEQQAAINGLASAMSVAGGFSKNAASNFAEFALSLQKTTTVADEVIARGATLLVSLGRLRGEGLEKATKAALDLSAGLGIDVESAFTLVAKAADGNVTALSRYGIRVRDAHDASKNFAAALDQINVKFGGLAGEKVKTFSGAISQLHNNFNDIQEAVGNFIIQSPALIGTIAKISSVFAKFADSIGGNKSDILGNIIRQFISLAVTLNSVVTPTVEFALNLITNLFNSFKTGVTAIFTGILASITGWTDILATVLPDTFGAVNDKMRQLLEDNKTLLVDSANTTATKWGDTFNFGISAKFDEVLVTTQSFYDKFSTTLAGIPDVAEKAKNDTNAKLEALRVTISTIIGSTLVNVASGGVQRLGAALLKGGAAFADFKNFALNALGDMSIHMGEAMITQSAAFAALAALISNPFTAAGASIAFGLALIALGGVLKAAAGGAGGAGAGAATSGAGDTGGGIATSGGPSTALVEERKEPGTSLVVNVQGNILDRKESGLAIAEIIQDTFGSNGIKFGTA